ncbi:MAG: ATP-binding protein [Nanoarchaeota archaeon]|nr:ATP-binding protein [Nanoarchaeota archaeon]MBU1704421.1 ATP-binding protein [Nanoarchaeota archaeon]
MGRFERDNTELLELDNIDSLIRKIVREHGSVKLEDMGLKPYLVPSDYESISFSLEKEDPCVVDHHLHPLYDVLKKADVPHYVTAPIGEAVINAYVHGNKKSDKPVAVHYKDNGDHVHVLVEDKGGRLDPEFVSYLLRHRSQGYNPGFTFYDFAGVGEPDERGGVGTIVMHRYSDGIGYHMSPEGGLIVSLRFNKPNR